MERANDDDRARALELLRRHGADVTSFQLLAPGYRYFFFDAGGERDGRDEADAPVAVGAGGEPGGATGAASAGFVAYVDTGRAWVAGGGPVAAPSSRAALARAFAAEARRHGRRASFFAVDDALCEVAQLPHVRVGEQPCWEPSKWESLLATHASLRYQIRRAAGKGVTVRRVPSEEMADESGATRRAVTQLARQWLGSQPLAPMGFLVALAPFDFPAERLYLVAEHEGRVVGFLAAAPVYARRGWLVENLLRTRLAPNGTAEALVDRLMRLAADEHSSLVSLGLAPLAGPVPRRLQIARSLGAPLYDFRGLQAFKAKLRPDGWESLHVAAAPGGSPWLALADGLTAFARGSLLRFGFATLARGPLAVLWALTALLVVWTPLLALAPADRFFPSPAVQHAWVLFDVVLAGALWSLCRKHRSWLAVAVASVVTLDALVTAGFALTFNIEHARGVLDVLVIAAACTGPVLAAIALWGFVRRRALVQP